MSHHSGLNRVTSAKRYLPLTAVWIVCTVSSVTAQNWPTFRGPDASGVAPAAAAPPVTFDVPASRNVAWRTPIPGLAHSSPIAWGDRIFLTTAVAATGEAPVRTGNAGIDAANDMVSHTWRLLAIDAKTGAVSWDRAVHTGVPRLKRHVKASHASATPATNGRVIVTLLGTEGLFCFDMDGQLRWKQDLGVMDVGLVDDPTYQWGPASSPIILENLVIVQNDRHKESFLAAYDVDTGKQVWQAERDELPSWATPLIRRRGGRVELVTNSGKFIRGYEPRTGQELWRFPDSATQVKVPTPVAAGDLIIVTGGYPPNGRPIYALRPGLNGAVDEREALAWKVDRGSPYTPTPLVHDGILYACSDNGILTAYDTKTGERVYQHRISDTAGGFSASPVAAAGRIYLTSEDGEVFVVRAGRTFELLAANALGEVAMATPAISGDMLIVRTRHHLVGLAEPSSERARAFEPPVGSDHPESGPSGRVPELTQDTYRLGQMHAVLTALHPSRPVEIGDAERMLALLEKSEVEGLSAADRRSAMTQLYRELWRIRGFDVEAGASAITATANMAAALFGFGARFSLETHAPPPGAPEGRIHVVRRGTGPVPMLLVSDVVIPASELYGTFMARNADRYTMYAVTLPGFGEARVPPRPAVIDYSRIPWLIAAERQMAEFLVRENLEDVVVIGTAAGGYFSAALAARHPERIRAAVVVNGLVNAPMRSPADPNRPAELAERLALSRRAAPIELTPSYWPPASREALRKIIANPPRGSRWGNLMGFASRDTNRTMGWTVDFLSPGSVWRQARYAAELGATDLTPDLVKLQRPILVIASIHDHLSPGIGVPVEAQWTEVRLRAPQAPVTIASFADVRHYASLDAPELFDQAVDRFLAGREVVGTTTRAPAALASPFATTSLYIGASEMRVHYFRLGVKGREIWGALVPYDRLWRTGANEAPTITFSHDVTIEGRPLAAGTYTLLTIPGRTEWTLVFNRVPWQFGLVSYDPAFDALRVAVPAGPAGMREWFEIAAEPAGPADALVTLGWERIAVSFRVALAGQER